MLEEANEYFINKKNLRRLLKEVFNMGGIGTRINKNQWIFLSFRELRALWIFYFILMIWYFIGFGFLATFFIALKRKIEKKENDSLWKVFKKVHNEYQLQGLIGLIILYFVWLFILVTIGIGPAIVLLSSFFSRK
jgi:hypothetical protein